MQLTEDATTPRESGTELAHWLEHVAATGDLTVAPPPGVPGGEAYGAAVDAMRSELAAYAEIVDSARDAIARNAAELRTIVDETARATSVVQHVAGAVADASAGARQIAHAGSSLGAYVEAAGTTQRNAGAELHAMAETLARAAGGVDGARESVAAMRDALAGIARFLETLKRTGDQTRLLAVSAAIEAAHAADRHGFAIVSQQVRALAETTGSSTAQVDAAAKELDASVRGVDDALREALASIRRAHGDEASTTAAFAVIGTCVDELAVLASAISAAAEEQSATLGMIAESGDAIAERAAAAAAAATQAADLDLESALAGIATVLAAYRLTAARDARTARAAMPSTGSAAGGDAGAEAALAALTAAVEDDERRILRGIGACAVAMARNAFAWRQIGAASREIDAQLESIRTAVLETATSARKTGELAGRVREVSETVRSGFATMAATVGVSLDESTRARDRFEGVGALVEHMERAAGRGAEILAVIEDVSTATTLLSLNAAIEAAHAGAVGRSFSVIAGEIRALANGTERSVRGAAELVSAITAHGDRTARDTRRLAEETSASFGHADAVRAEIGELSGRLDETLTFAMEVSASAEEQTRALDSVLATVSDARAVRDDRFATTDAQRLAMSFIGERAHAIAARRRLGTVAERIRAESLAFAERFEAEIEKLIDRGTLSVERCLTYRYEELTGAAIARLGRLFDVSRVPASGFTPPKYETPWDPIVEGPGNALCEQMLADVSLISTLSIVDLNGFMFSGGRDLHQDWTGDPVRDAAGSRLKRFYEDAYTVHASRIGLGIGEEAVPLRAPYEAFVRTGARLEQTGERPQSNLYYARDIGVVYNEVVTALYVRGRRFATLRVLYDADML
jgi:methyl-accepting chemotaxis protein